MDSYQKAREEIIRLELEGKVLDTPTLCRELSEKYGLSHTTVFELLLEIRTSPRASFKRKRPVGRPPKALSENEVISLFELVCRPAQEYGFRSALWTPQRVIKMARQGLGMGLTKDTIWANLKRFGLTFDKQLERCLGSEELPFESKRLLKEKRGLLYVVTELHPEDLGIDLAAVALVGLTPSRKMPLACTVHRRDRIKTDFVEYFLRELLTLHPERHLAVLMRHKSAYRTEKLKRLELRHRRLHLFEL